MAIVKQIHTKRHTRKIKSKKTGLTRTVNVKSNTNYRKPRKK